MAKTKYTAAERLVLYSIRETDGGCASWTRATDEKGYGLLRVDGRIRKAHRLAWTLGHGVIPDGMHVLHRCDNRRCINVDHLFLGTHQENMADRSAKGRQARGERAGLARLTAEQAGGHLRGRAVRA